MKRVILADQNDIFIDRIKQFFLPRYAGEMDIVFATSADEVSRLCAEKFPDAILLNPALYEGCRGSLMNIPVLFLMEKFQQELPQNAQGVSKYRKVDELYQEIQKPLQNGEAYIIERKAEVCEIIMFQSASGGTGCSTMANVCARALAKAGRKVLYLNLETLGTSSFYFRTEGDADILSFMKSIESSMALDRALQSSIKQDISGVSLLESVKNAKTYVNLDKKRLLDALVWIQSEKLYDFIVVDKPMDVSAEHLEWLKKSTRLFFVTSGTDVGNLKFARAYSGGLLDALDDGSGSLGEKCQLIYNMVKPENFTELSHFKMRVFGKVDFQSGMGKSDVERVISDQVPFEQLTK